MRQIKWMALAIIVAMGLSGCEMTSIEGNPTDKSNPASIFGLWQEQDNDHQKEYMRFLTDEQEAKDGEYFFGREWDEDDDTYETDLKYKGDGWFKWKIEGSTLTMIELMDNGGADIPKRHTITTLSTTTLKMKETDDMEVEIWIRKE